jgi:hypothetical protein
MAEAFERAHRMGQVEEAFIGSHPVDGLTAGEYAKQLRAEAFECRVQLRKKIHAGTGPELGSFTFSLEPDVRCAREPSGYPECAELRVVLDVDWKHPEIRPLAVLAGQLNETPIRRVAVVCESRPPSPEDRASIARGLASGDIARVK